MNTFLLAPAHRDFALGKSKKLTRSSRLGIGCMTLFVGIFILLGAVFLAYTVNDIVEWFMISRSGVLSTAQYVDRRISSDEDSKTYFVTFRYLHNDREYSREQSVDKDVYNRADMGENVEIIYVPASPQMAKVVHTNNLQIVPLLFVLFWNGIVYLGVFFLIRYSRKRRLLERSGKMLRGEILEAMMSSDNDGDYSLKVKYAFEVPPSNKRLTKTESATRNDLKKQRPPAPGTPVIILYYNEQTYMLL